MEQGEKQIKEGDTISLDELVRRMREHGKHPGTKNKSKLLLFNAAAALEALGRRVEEQDAKIAELMHRPTLVGPGGQRVN